MPTRFPEALSSLVVPFYLPLHLSAPSQAAAAAAAAGRLARASAMSKADDCSTLYVVATETTYSKIDVVSRKRDALRADLCCAVQWPETATRCQ